MGECIRYEVRPIAEIGWQRFLEYLRDYTTKNIRMEHITSNGERFLKFGDIGFAADQQISLLTSTGPGKMEKVSVALDSLVFLCGCIESTIYLDYARKAAVENKQPLRRYQFQELKRYLLGTTQQLPCIIDLIEAAPTPLEITLKVSSVTINVENEENPSKAYYTLVHNREDGNTVKLSGQLRNSKIYRIILLNLMKNTKMKSKCQYYAFPSSKSLCEKMNITESVDNIIHAYVTIEGLPPTNFYGCGFGINKKDAKSAASRELLMRLYIGGITTPTFYQSIGFVHKNMRECKLKKRMRREMYYINANVRQLKDSLERGKVPKWFLSSAGEVSIDENIMLNAKIIVRETFGKITSKESKVNSKIRRMRHAMDVEEARYLMTKRNHYLKIYFSGNAARYGDGPSDQILPIIDIFGGEGLRDEEPRQDMQAVDVINFFDICSDANTDEQTCMEINQSTAENPPFISSQLGKRQNDDHLAQQQHNDHPSTSSDDSCCIIDEVPSKRVCGNEIITLDQSDQEDEVLSDNEEIQEITVNRVDKCDSNDNYSTKLRSVEPVAVDSSEKRKESMEKENPSYNRKQSAGTISSDERENVRSEIEEGGEFAKIHEDIGVTIVKSALSVTDLIENRKKQIRSAFIAFNNELWNHFRINSQDDRTFSWKMKIRQRLLGLIRRVYPKADLIAFGSTINGCGSYNSDMDLCLSISFPTSARSSKSAYTTHALIRLNQLFKTEYSTMIRSCEYVQAAVPILKMNLAEPFSELEIDLSCNNFAGIRNSHLLHYYARLDDRFPALCLIVKHWAIVVDINDAHMGTLNSYALELMVLHFLQCAVMPPVLPNLQYLHQNRFNKNVPLERLKLFQNIPRSSKHPINRTPVGELLIAFFDYYTRFDFFNNGISVRSGSLLKRSEMAQPDHYKISIEEPYTLLNVAATVRTVGNYEKIRVAFIHARNAFLGFGADPPSIKAIGID